MPSENFDEKIEKIIKFYINPMKCNEIFNMECDESGPRNLEKYKKFGEYKNIIKSIINNVLKMKEHKIRLQAVCKESLEELKTTLDTLSAEECSSYEHCEDLKYVINEGIITLNDSVMGESFRKKYLKYKAKYLKLKNEIIKL
jgi:hypothetical protein